MTKLKIHKKLQRHNSSSRRGAKIKYIVIHYTGAPGSAYNNATYFAREKLKASAGYFVDSKEVWQSVDDRYAAWHCGGGLQGSRGHALHGKVLNINSIGVEMCCVKIGGRLVVTDSTIVMTKLLVAYLMKKYKIPPERVVRHYDVTGKRCPAQFCYTEKGNKDWKYRVHPYLTGKRKLLRG